MSIKTLLRPKNELQAILNQAVPIPYKPSPDIKMTQSQQLRHKSLNQSINQSIYDVDPSEKQELRKFIKKQVKSLEDKAKAAIFEGLPELFLEISTAFSTDPLFSSEMAQQDYERAEALFFFKTDADRPLCLALQPELIQAFKPAEPENLLLAATPNRVVARLHSAAGKFIEKLRNVTEPLLFWLQHLLPKAQEDQNDPWSSFLLEALQHTNAVVEEFDDYAQSFMTYHQSRANIIRLIRKHPTTDHYTQIQLLDFKEIHCTRNTLQKLHTQIMVLYQTIGTGFKRIQNAGKSGSGVAGGVIM